MKTKVLMLMAVIGLVSANFAKAQTNAYSSNCVGFLNINVPPGFSIIANQMVRSNSTLAELFPDFPIGTQVYKYNGAGFSIAEMDEFEGTWVPNFTLVPGEAAFIKNSTTNTLVATFIGEVLQGNVTNNWSLGFSLRSCFQPIRFTPGTNSIGVASLNIPGQPGDEIYVYAPGQGYQIIQFDEFEMCWLPNLPIEVGQGFFVKKVAPGFWVRQFSVNN